MTAKRTASRRTGIKRAKNTYPLTVDYEMSVEDAVELGCYGWANDDINSRNFSTKRTGRADIVVELIRFNEISKDDVIRELNKIGFRPVELRELLAFGEKYPDIQRAFPIVAFGSVWQGGSGRRYVPYLHRDGSERGLYLDWLEDDWLRLCRFAVVRK